MNIVPVTTGIDLVLFVAAVPPGTSEPSALPLTAGGTEPVPTTIQ